MSTKELRLDRFIFSSDYMHLSKAGSITKNITIPATSVGANTSANGNVYVDFPVPAGAITRSIVSYKGTQQAVADVVPNLTTGSIQIEEMWDRGIVWRIYWYRRNDQQLTVYYNIRHYDPGTVTAPAITFTLTQTAFKPPNA